MYSPYTISPFNSIEENEIQSTAAALGSLTSIPLGVCNGIQNMFNVTGSQIVNLRLIVRGSVRARYVELGSSISIGGIFPLTLKMKISPFSMNVTPKQNKNLETGIKTQNQETRQSIRRLEV